MDSGKKIITIKNNDDSDNPVFVRVSAYAGSAYPLTFTPGDGWVEDTGKPGFWRYTKPVLPGKSTDTPLTITIDYGSDHKADEHFNVIVVHESVPALYVDDHYDIDASWSLGKVTVIEEGGSQS